MKYLFSGLLFLLPVIIFPQSKDVVAAKALAQRIVPSYSNNISFLKIPGDSGKDVFEIESANDHLIIRGNNSNAMSVGLNYYLRNYCRTDVSWNKNEGVLLPIAMPVILQKIRKEARCSERFFLNYCTFGYTMPWWQWSDWQWFIDWMALNGINMPLAITGQEAIWYKVWKKFGLTDDQTNKHHEFL